VDYVRDRLAGRRGVLVDRQRRHRRPIPCRHAPVGPADDEHGRGARRRVLAPDAAPRLGLALTADLRRSCGRARDLRGDLRDVLDLGRRHSGPHARRARGAAIVARARLESDDGLVAVRARHGRLVCCPRWRQQPRPGCSHHGRS
jgi:hypothetical protein